MKFKLGWSRLGNMVLVLFFALVGMFFTSQSTYRSVERWIDDFTARVFPKKASDAIVALDITSLDLEKYFGRAHNPLDPIVLQRIIEKIATAGPTLIAVDIDTSHAVFSRLSGIKWGSKIIWARGATQDPNHPDQWILGKVLGGEDKSAEVISGIAFLIDDPDDGRTRSYELDVETAPGTQVKTFQRQIAESFRRSQNLPYDESNPTQPRSIEFRDPRTRLTLPVSLVLEDRKDSVPWRSYVTNRIVLLGGTYDYADRHQTPFGEMAGVHVLANVVDTELDGRRRLRLGTFWVFIFSLIVYIASGLVIETISNKRKWLRRTTYALFLLGPPIVICVVLIIFGRGESIPALILSYLVLLFFQLLGECIVEPNSKKLFRWWDRKADSISGSKDKQ